MSKLVKRNGTLVIEDLWYPDDIRERAEAMGHSDLTMDQIESIMERICDDFDANYGINWDVIDSAVEVEFLQ
jgi:hypothetical protein